MGLIVSVAGRTINDPEPYIFLKQLLNHDNWKIYEIFPLPSFPTPQIQTKPTPLSMEQTNSIINGAKPKFAKES